MVRRASISCALSVALVVTAIPVAASSSTSSALDEYTIRCESGGRRRYCPADTDGRAQIVRQLSKSRCDQWRTWGYDRRGVWVDRGCRAEFRVGKDGGIGTGGAVAIGGAVAGAAILAAILANKNNDHKDETLGAQDWMVGRFRGFSPKHDRDFEIKVERNGSVSGDSEGDRLSGHVTKDRLHLGDSEFKLQKESWGFQATHVDDSDEVIYFRKQ
jgi:hypothetical protein